MEEVKGCLHLEVSDEGVCENCGVDITTTEFLNSLPEPPSDAELGNVIGIINLAQRVADEYIELAQHNADPKHPTLPRMRLVGGRLMRLPNEYMWPDLLKGSFREAKQLGYRGTYQRWGEIVKEIFEKTDQKGEQSRIL